MTVLDAKGFQPKDFASLHPAGRLGKRLMRVETLMHSGEACPIVTATTGMRDVIYEMSRKRLGMTCVVDERQALIGVITDGDIRRQMEKADNVLGMAARDVMTHDPITIAPGLLAVEALNIMERRKVTAIVVVDEATARVTGVVHLHDLWRTELV
jgi:arabinose-5-phosphate isomerase